jgi:hypothetical protein
MPWSWKVARIAGIDVRACHVLHGDRVDCTAPLERESKLAGGFWKASASSSHCLRVWCFMSSVTR